MLKFFNGEERQRILILNYNTILIQSVGFLDYMKKNYGIDNPFSNMDDTEYIVNVLRYAHKNTARLIDSTIDDDFYFNFIKTNFNEISYTSPPSDFQYNINILCNQSFIEEIHIASPVQFNIKEIFVNVKDPVFDIFDVDQIVQYINDNRITSLFVHDIELLRDIIEHPKMDSQQFVYLLSKIGYNYQEIEDALFFKIPEILILKDQKQFLLGVVNILHIDETENFLI